MLKLQYFGHLMRRADSLGKTMLLGKTEGKRRSRQQRAEDEMVGSKDGNGGGGWESKSQTMRILFQVLLPLAVNCSRQSQPFCFIQGPVSCAPHPVLPERFQGDSHPPARSGSCCCLPLLLSDTQLVGNLIKPALITYVKAQRGTSGAPPPQPLLIGC